MSTDLAYFNITLSNNISNIVIPHINMLCPFMKYLIFVRQITLWLSQNIVVQDVTPHSSVYKPLNQIASLHASEIAIYSASVVEQATIDCKVASRFTPQPTMVKT